MAKKERKGKKDNKQGNSSKKLKDFELPKPISNKKKKKKHFLNRKKTRVIIIILAIILAITIITLAYQLDYIENPFSSVLSQPTKFIIKDECSLIIGQLIHPIKDSGTCELRCKNNCILRQMEFDSSEFRLQEGNCNACDCYCK